MGDTESRPLSEGSSPGRSKEREMSGGKDGHVRLQEDRDEVDAEDADAEKLKAQGELLVYLRYPEAVVQGSGDSYTNEHFKALLGMIQKSAPDWVISLEARKTDSFAEQVTFHRLACATGRNAGLPIVDVAILYVFDETTKHIAPPGDHQAVVACINSSLNPHSKYHVRIRWDVTSKDAMERSALQLITS